MRTSSLVLACLASAAILAGFARQHRWRVGLRSFGPVRYGMTLAEASRALGEPLRFEEVEGGCGYARSPSMPPRTSFMVVDGRIGRVDVDSAGVATFSGAQVGSSEEEVRRRYPGRIRTRMHEYLGPDGHYLTFVPPDPADSSFGMVFETDGRRVISYRAGIHPVVDYIEGCS